MAGANPLLEYLQTTAARLNAEGFAPDAQTLKTKIMPSVEESIRRLSHGAPGPVRTQLKAALEEGKVYPSFEADIDELRAAVNKCIQILGGGAGPTDATAEAGYVKAEPEQAKPAEKVEEAEEEEECDFDDPFAMMGGMGAEEVYVCTMKEATPEEQAAAKERQNQMAAATIEEETEEPQGEGDEAPAPTTNGEKEAAGQGSKALKDYLESSLTRLSADGFEPEEALLKGKIMPSIVESVRRMSAPAPAELRNKLKEALVNAKVMPAYECDLDTFRGALQKCLDSLEE